jgi:hypothetical protein
MGKIKIIILREYLTRVKKKSFIVMTFLGPILMAGIWVLPFILATMNTDEKRIQILDDTGLFEDRFVDTKTMKFTKLSIDVEVAKANLLKSGDYGLVWIPKTELSVPSTAIFYSSGQASLEVTSYIKSIIFPFPIPVSILYQFTPPYDRYSLIDPNQQFFNLFRFMQIFRNICLYTLSLFGEAIETGFCKPCRYNLKKI